MTRNTNDPFFKHQVEIAKKTLKMNDIGVLIMGGMTKDEAREILKRAKEMRKKENKRK